MTTSKVGIEIPREISLRESIVPVPPPSPSPSRRDDGLGSVIEDALARIGLTSVVVEEWLGKECMCKERRDKLNSLSYWAKRVVGGKVEMASRYLEELLQ